MPILRTDIYLKAPAHGNGSGGVEVAGNIGTAGLHIPRSHQERNLKVAWELV